MTSTPATTPDLRYPIGSYRPPEDFTAALRRDWIDELERTPGALRTAISGLSDAQLDTPYRPGGWTVRQVVHHLPDSHMNAYVRFRLALTEDRPTIKTYDETRWAELEDARTAPPDSSLKILEGLHERLVRLLRSMRDGDFDRAFVHPEHGRAVTLNWTLGMYAWHCRHHVAHITALREREGW